MSGFLKGNYDLSLKPAAPAKDEAAVTSNREFERRAMERLGGSIAFVVKKDFVWKGDKKSE
jgi:hypothetical protein